MNWMLLTKLLWMLGAPTTPNPCATPVMWTVDDGPHQYATKHLRKLFKERGIKATWFVLGAQLGKRGIRQFKLLKSDGHLFANHLWTHKDPCKLGTRGVLKELHRNERWVKRLAGTSWRKWYRPPNGQQCGVRAVRKLGYKLVMWHISDIGKTAKQLWRRLWWRMRKGKATIMLHHSHWWKLRDIFKMAAKKGCFLKKTVVNVVEWHKGPNATPEGTYWARVVRTKDSRVIASCSHKHKTSKAAKKCGMNQLYGLN